MRKESVKGFGSLVGVVTGAVGGFLLLLVAAVVVLVVCLKRRKRKQLQMIALDV